METLSNLSSRLDELMREKEIGTQELAAKVQIDQSVIARILRAQRMPSAKTLVALADYFRCSADYLLGRKELPDEHDFLQRPPFSERLAFLLTHFKIGTQELAAKVQIDQSVIARILRAQRMPSAKTLVALAVTKYRLTKETHLTEETIRRWQSGRFEPTTESLIRLADYFGCSVDFILGREN